MPICVTGSIATDHLMTFQGRFAESIIPEELDNLSLSFLVSDLQIRRGGTGANIAFSLGVLGQQPVLAGAVGADAADYLAWLSSHGVDTESVLVSAAQHTARFTCTTDLESKQIASFYPGAMSEAGAVTLSAISERVGPLSIVVISPNDPGAMINHTNECRAAGIPFVADPSQQLTFMDADLIRDLVEGAEYLFTNEYESALIEKKTGWTPDDILDNVRFRVTTLAEKGCVIESKGEPAIEVPAVAVSPADVVDPTGVGDAFRSGFLAGLAAELPHERCAQIGATIAAFVIQTVGPQEFEFTRDGFIARLADAYGQAAGDDVSSALPI